MTSGDILYKTVGKVNIIELFGSCIGNWARTVVPMIQSRLKGNGKDALLYQARSVDEIDRSGAMALGKISRIASKSAFVTERDKVASMIEIACSEQMVVVRSSEEVAFLLGREFSNEAEGNKEIREQRRHERLETALPLRFSYFDGDGADRRFFAVVTNMSVGGLHAHFIDSQSETEARLHIGLYDLRLLDLELCLERGSYVRVPGKVIRAEAQGSGVGMEFYDPEPSVIRQLEAYLMRMRERGAEGKGSSGHGNHNVNKKKEENSRRRAAGRRSQGVRSPE